MTPARREVSGLAELRLASSARPCSAIGPRVAAHFPWRQAVSALACVGAALTSPSAAQAEDSTAALSVMRAQGSEVCPDASTLVSTIATLFPKHPLREASSPAEAADHVFISIRPSGSGHAAELAVFGRHRVLRRIVDDDPDCRGLPAALAVALVMLHGAPPTARTPSAREAPESLVLSPHLGLLSGFGFLGKPAPGGFAGIGVGQERGLAVVGRAIRAVSLPIERDGGEVQFELWAGTLAACWRLPRPGGWSIMPCAEFSAGAERGEASGYRTDGAVTRAWMAAGPSLTGGLLWTEGLELQLTGSVDAALSSTRWVVEGTGTVLRQPAVGAFLGLALAYRVPVGEFSSH